MVNVLHEQSAFIGRTLAQLLREADPRFTQGKTEEDLVKFLQTVHTKLGEPGAVRLVCIHVKAATNGSFTPPDAKRRFSRGPALETFTWTRTAKTLPLYAYDIAPMHPCLNEPEVLCRKQLEAIALQVDRWVPSCQSKLLEL
jgi:hypothetical protein